MDRVPGHRRALAFRRAFADDVRLPQSLEERRDDVSGRGHVGLGLARESVCQAQKKTEAAEGRDERSVNFSGCRAFGTGKCKFALVKLFDRVKSPRIAEFI